MTIWSWLRLSAGLWLVRKGVKLSGWLLAFAIVIAAWPLTLVTIAGYVAAWWRGWPAARLRRATAWSLILPAAWLAAAAVRVDRLRAAALAGVRAWEHGWPLPAVPGAVRTFVLLSPAAVPAGMALAAATWAWRNYAITTGLAGITASAPITFDRRQWRRQARTAKSLTDAPGAVPLLARGGKIPVGGTIRAIGHRWHPVFALPATACARHMAIVGATGSEDELDDPVVGGLGHRDPGRRPVRSAAAAAADRAGLQGRPGRPPQGRPDPPPAVRGGGPPGRGLAG
jgi:hypothetical protein